MTLPKNITSKANANASRWIIFIRLALAGVFIPEGMQKLLHPDLLGAGRFMKIGIPYPELMGPFVGIVEIVCGTLILVGLFTRFAAVPLIITMLVAIATTKIPIWMGHDWIVNEALTFYVRTLNQYGFWSFMHETRLDWAMLMGACYLLFAGSGKWSLDRLK